jgi:hypothetical protein
MAIEIPVVGGLYGSQSSDGTFRVTKVLVVDEFAVHVRMYAERFNHMPTDVSSSQLSLGSFGGPSGFGIGHAPLSREGFLKGPRTHIATEEVSEDELEGYRIWAGEDEV